MYLISVTSREEVANVWNKSIYAIRDVTLIPLTSKTQASKVIASAQASRSQTASLAYGEEPDESDAGEDAEVSSIGSGDDEPKQRPEDEAGALEGPKSGITKQSTNFVKNVMQEKGKYGRFATRWFSRNGGQTNARRSQGLTKEQENQEARALPKEDAMTENTGTKSKEHDNHGIEVQEGINTGSTGAMQKRTTIEHLTPRILRSARLYFSSSGFYFSYEHDLSGSLKNDTSSSLSLWKRFDPLVSYQVVLLAVISN